MDSIFNSLGYIHRNGIAESYGNSIFIFFTNHHPAFHSSFTILHSHQQYTGVLNPHPNQHIVRFFYNNHLNGYEVVSHCGFDLHVPNYLRCLSSFYVLPCHLYIFIIFFLNNFTDYAIIVTPIFLLFPSSTRYPIVSINPPLIHVPGSCM